jgi:ABC-type multidrug transport system permease subunit
MKQVLLIAHNDIRMFLREKMSWFWLIVIPILFSFFMGFAAPGPGNPQDPRPSLLLQNQDEGFLGGLLVAELEAQDLNLLGADHAAEAERGLRIPPDFTVTVQQKQQAKVQFFTLNETRDPSAAMVELRLWRALIALNAALVERALDSGDEAVRDEPALDLVLQRPNIVRVDARFAGRRPVPVKFNQSLPGNLVMMVMLNLLIFGGSSLAGERQAGVLRRLVVHPIRRHELVWGKIYGRFLLGLVQSSVMLVFGAFVLKVPVFRDPLGILLIVAAYAWTCASFGVLIGATAKNPDKIVGLCILAALLMAAIGGCWWPLEIAPQWLQSAAHCIPAGWAMDGFHQLISFGGTFRDIGWELAALAGFAIAGSLAAGRLLRC